MKLSILIPVYNEIRTLSTILNKIIHLKIDKELVIVDDYSTDGSRELLKEKYGAYSEVKLIFHSKNMGKGCAIKTAIAHANGDFSIIQDADLEYDPNDYTQLLNAAINKDVKVVYGSRFLKTRKTTSFWHFLVNKFLTEITNILFKANLTDMETCYKMLKTDLFKKLNIQAERFDIEVEITAKLLKNKVKILEVPISYKGRSYHEGKKITWKDGISTLWALIKFRFIK